MKGFGAAITAISYYLPEKVVDNKSLVQEFGTWTEDKIYQKTGIRERHVVDGELVSDLAARAAEKLFEEHGVDRETIDFLLLCTESPDHYLPATACIVQDMVGLKKSIGALDYNLGCSGFVYGLALAKGLISAGIASKILLITADTLTRTIHPMDKSTRTIFGDAAAATLVERSETGRIGDFVLGTDGSGRDKLIIPAGAWAAPRSAETAVERTNRWGNTRTPENLYMNGPEVLNFTLTTVPDAVYQALETHSISLGDVDLFVFHQATKLMLNHLREVIGIPEEKFFMNMENKGNTVSATIPMALKDASDAGLIHPGSYVMVAGFGVGYSWGATIIRW
ncbi:MAG: ketoacyl-ACP synthase III [Synergistaceae bacterium]|uniref:3-oxoacyl-ACP synthase III family protein n=1 Tax=Aminivibrio sp. TaxID=1872489 RepID=UPI0016B89709|nr:ketoacyl-ACP synthase III [Synergistaceae bacterium]MDD3390629.1 ketoacyl-ACP synthase III [Synergistaceae bacterium]MDD3688604.1 ketoacyl-ACP synthase III [Synergistaceae bacterium]MDD4020820.1 ketoacyl-ACP synthase III [Synergistaceae bacterium]MDD4612164.1 ketoacyl-ACP synthase III [Synergistaceae bacterium]